jgi:hypothetical protein
MFAFIGGGISSTEGVVSGEEEDDDDTPRSPVAKVWKTPSESLADHISNSV